jgi:bzd-type benzoyl-CoA reductase N subunit
MSQEVEAGGLAAVERLYQDYGRRARELKAQGRQVIGYLCAYTPVEIIEAAGLVPFRIKGSVTEPISKADTQLETIVCPLVRSCYDLALKQRYEFLDGLVIPHACDSMARSKDVWKYTLGLPYFHFIDTPHNTSDSSLDFFVSVLGTFCKSLGKFAGKEISAVSLAQAIKAYNENRTRIWELYELRKSDPPLLSGAEMTKVLVAAMSLPVREATRLLEGVLAEVKQRPPFATEKKPRIMVVGAEVDDAAFIELIEAAGAWVVTDDLCPGGREHRAFVKTEGDPVAALAERYLRGIMCGRSYVQPAGDYPQYLEQRFGHITRAARDYGVDGIVLYIYKYCDPFGFEVPAMKSFIEAQGIPVLYLEDEYSMSTIGRLRTRIQAFLEMLGTR